MEQKLEALIDHVKQVAAHPNFVHHAWFVRWHLEIVERMADELSLHYPEADRDVITAMVWLYDYGKILDFDNQYTMTLTAGREKLAELGFADSFADTVISGIETLDKKLAVDLRTAPIEVKIVSTADGCSHMVGPFMSLWWYEHADKPYSELMQDTVNKHSKDWNHKIVLPEARLAFKDRYRFLREQAGILPEKFFPQEDSFFDE